MLTIGCERKPVLNEAWRIFQRRVTRHSDLDSSHTGVHILPDSDLDLKTGMFEARARRLKVQIQCFCKAPSRASRSYITACIVICCFGAKLRVLRRLNCMDELPWCVDASGILRCAKGQSDCSQVAVTAIASISGNILTLTIQKKMS